MNSVKVKALFALNLILERQRERCLKFKEIKAVVNCLGKGLSAAAAEVRSMAKEGLMVMKETLSR